MKHTFNYFYTMQPNDSFFVDDISNFTLNLLNDSGQEWYIDVDTELGNTRIRKFGPLMVDSDKLLFEFKYEYNELQFVEQKIINIVDRFINNEKSSITQIIEIDRDNFNDRIRGVISDSC